MHIPRPFPTGAPFPGIKARQSRNINIKKGRTEPVKETVTYKDIRGNKEINQLIEKGNEILGVLG